MDSLALLCTLHADGPATLRRLRKAGCQSLVDLDRVGAESIAAWLAIPPAVARRLVREGRILHERVGDDTLDAEEAPEGMAVAPLGNSQAPLTECGELGDKDRDLIRQVLGDARPVSGLRSLSVESNGVALEPMGGAFTAQEISQPETSETFEASGDFDGGEVPQSEPVALTYPMLGRVDGLDAKVAATLSEAGIETLTALVEADASRLARSTGLSFGPLRRLQFLARKSLQVGGEISIPVAAEVEPAASAGPDFASASEGTVASFVLPRPAQFSSLQGENQAPQVPIGFQTEPEAIELEPVSPMAPIPEAEDPFAKEIWPEAKTPLVKELEPEAAGPMAEPTPLVGVAPKAAAAQPLGRWMPREMREAQSRTEECNEPEPVLIPPPPPRRFWEPKRFWEARKNKRKAAVEGEKLQETENFQGGNLPPAAAPAPKQGEPTTPSKAPVEMPTGKDLGDLRWDFREPQFRPESGDKGGFQFEEPTSQEEPSDASGPFA
ncbi:MAG: hypothetical protein ACI87O_000762 [Planctomycetota bacterium]|jgi:hypothetical protein